MVSVVRLVTCAQARSVVQAIEPVAQYAVAPMTYVSIRNPAPACPVVVHQARPPVLQAQPHYAVH